jgi:hypothetical protein
MSLALDDTARACDRTASAVASVDPPTRRSAGRGTSRFRPVSEAGSERRRTKLHKQTHGGGASWTAVDPHDDVILVRLGTGLEEVEEEVFAVADVEIAGVGAVRASTPRWMGVDGSAQRFEASEGSTSEGQPANRAASELERGKGND